MYDNCHRAVPYQIAGDAWSYIDWAGIGPGQGLYFQLKGPGFTSTKGYLQYVIQPQKVNIGGSGTKNDTMVVEYDKATRIWGNPQRVAPYAGIPDAPDDHNLYDMVVNSDGHIIMAGGSHSNSCKVITSGTAHDLSSMSGNHVSTGPWLYDSVAQHSYNRLIIDSTGNVYCFFRNQVTKCIGTGSAEGSALLAKSTVSRLSTSFSDWDSGNIVIAEDCTLGDPYTWAYIGNVCVDSNDDLHFCWMWRIALDDFTKCCYVKWDVSENKWYKADGTEVTIPLAYADCDTVHTDEDIYAAHVAVDPDDRPWVSFFGTGNHPQAWGISRLCYHDGTSWSTKLTVPDTPAASAGSYHGTPFINDQGHIYFVFMLRTGTFTSDYKSDVGYRLSTDGGDTWTDDINVSNNTITSRWDDTGGEETHGHSFAVSDRTHSDGNKFGMSYVHYNVVRYWDADPDISDEVQSETWTTDANGAWDEYDLCPTIGGGRLYYHSRRSNVPGHITKDLGAALTTDWILDFVWTPNESTANGIMAFGIWSADKDYKSSDDDSEDGIYMRVDAIDTSQVYARIVAMDGGTETNGTQLTVDNETEYFCRVERQGSIAKLSICTDMARKTHVSGSPSSASCTDVANLRYLIQSNYGDNNDVTEEVSGSIAMIHVIK